MVRAKHFFWMVFYTIECRYLISVLLDVGGYPYKTFPFLRLCLLYGLVIGVTLFLAFFVLKEERSFIASLRLAAIPGLVTLLYYYRFNKTVVISISLMCLSLFIIGLFKINLILIRNKDNRIRKCKVMECVFREVFSRISYLAAVVIILYAVCSIFCPTVINQMDEYEESTEFYSMSQDQIYDDVYDNVYDIRTLLDKKKADLLVFTRYSESSEEEKYKGLQALLDCELDYFGVDEHINIIIKRDMDTYNSGYYVPEENCLFINATVISDVDESIATVLHEGRHCFQAWMIRYALENDINLDQPIFKEILDWKINMDNYIGSKEEEMTKAQYFEYVTQPLERDANYMEQYLGVIAKKHIEKWEVGR